MSSENTSSHEILIKFKTLDNTITEMKVDPNV